MWVGSLGLGHTSLCGCYGPNKPNVVLLPHPPNPLKILGTGLIWTFGVGGVVVQGWVTPLYVRVTILISQNWSFCHQPPSPFKILGKGLVWTFGVGGVVVWGWSRHSMWVLQPKWATHSPFVTHPNPLPSPPPSDSPTLPFQNLGYRCDMNLWCGRGGGLRLGHTCPCDVTAKIG